MGRLIEAWGKNEIKIWWYLITGILLWLGYEEQYSNSAFKGFFVGVLWLIFFTVAFRPGFTHVDDKEITDEEKGDAEHYIRLMREIREKDRQEYDRQKIK